MKDYIIDSINHTAELDKQYIKYSLPSLIKGLVYSLFQEIDLQEEDSVSKRRSLKSEIAFLSNTFHSRAKVIKGLKFHAKKILYQILSSDSDGEIKEEFGKDVLALDRFLQNKELIEKRVLKIISQNNIKQITQK